MMISPEKLRKVEEELRHAMDSGSLLGEALRVLHHGKGVGLIFLWPAVMSILETDRGEAMRISVREVALKR
jgi:hypothetical protein